MNTFTYSLDPNGCHLCTSNAPSGDGYPAKRVNGKMVYVSRLVYAEQHGPIPEGKVVRRTCSQRLCINPDHLELATAADVGSTSGRRATGSRHGRAKLTEDDVRAILASDEGTTALARRHGVDPKLIRAIRAREVWRHVTWPAPPVAARSADDPPLKGEPVFDERA